METFIKKLIKEHRDLRNKIENLQKHLIKEKLKDDVDIDDYSIKYSQALIMTQYLVALESRLKLYGIICCEDGTYHKIITTDDMKEIEDVHFMDNNDGE